MNLVVLLGGIIVSIIVFLAFLALGGFSLFNKGTKPSRKPSRNEDIILSFPGYGDAIVESCETISPGLGHYILNFGGTLNPRIEYKNIYDKQIKSPSLRQRICGNPKYEVISMYDPTTEKFVEYGGKNNGISEEKVGEEQKRRQKLEEARGEAERVRGEPLRQFNRILDSVERIRKTEGQPGFPRQQ